MTLSLYILVKGVLDHCEEVKFALMHVVLILLGLSLVIISWPVWTFVIGMLHLAHHSINCSLCVAIAVVLCLHKLMRRFISYPICRSTWPTFWLFWQILWEEKGKNLRFVVPAFDCLIMFGYYKNHTAFVWLGKDWQVNCRSFWFRFSASV